MQSFHEEMKIASSGNTRNKVFAVLEPDIKVGAQLMPAVKFCSGGCRNNDRPGLPCRGLQCKICSPSDVREVEPGNPQISKTRTRTNIFSDHI